MSDLRSFNAKDGLAATGVDQSWLARVLPRIDTGTIQVREAPGWFMRLWAKGIVAVAMPWGIYFTPAMMDRYESGAEPLRLGQLLVHELTHIEQVKRSGLLRHTVTYVFDYLKGRLARKGHWDSYGAIRHEIEARSVAKLVMAGPR
ncbi:MAG: hypothetical protein HKN91_17430 [Acidimicrobiia bacterium]|nr:hypothetical protein [Acidimicrobiia bacterium]